MRRLSILSLVAVLSLVGLIAGPASAKGATTSTFTIAQPIQWNESPGTLNPHGGIRDAVYRGIILSSDGRVAGNITWIVNVSPTKPGGVWDWQAQMWGTFHIENAQGSWEGSWRGSRGPGAEGVHIIDAVGRGAGAYEGLHIKFHMQGVSILDWVGTGEILDPGHH